MSEYAKMLLAKRANVWEQAKTLLDRAAAEKRELTAEEQAGLDKMNTDLDSLRSQVDKLADAERNARETEEALRKLAETPVEQRAADQAPSAEQRQAELRAFLRGERRSIEFSGNVDFQGMQKRALGGTTAGAGVETQPTNFYNKLWASAIQTAALLRAGVTVLQTSNGDTIQIPSADAFSTGAWVDAGASIGESDPHFVQRSLSAYKFALLVSVDRELTEDTGVDLEGFLSMQAGRAVGNGVGSAIAVGDGTKKPTGITVNSTLGVTSATGAEGKPTFDDVINLYYSVIPQYRAAPSCAFVMEDSTAGFLRTLKTSYGVYLWQPGLTVGTPDTILGKPVVIEPYMPATGLNNKSILFGDLSAYFARVVNGIRFEQSLDYAFGNDQVTFRCILRADGVLVDQTGAVKHFVGAAS
ncbi:MAG TPA: phage major capsid protein [Nocardioides sp.]|nr:phage major capsid protein [Nocardioides sp.]